MSEPTAEDPEYERDAPVCPWPSRPAHFLPVPGFPAYRVGSDRTVWVNDTPPGLDPPWDRPRWRKLKARGRSARGASYDLRSGGVTVCCSAELIYGAASGTAPAAAIAATRAVRRRRPRPPAPPPPLQAPPVPPPVVPAGPLPEPEPEPGAFVEYRDVPRFPGYRVGSDRTVWAWAGRDGSGPWKQVREYRRGPSVYVSMARGRLRYSLGVTVLWSVTFGPGTAPLAGGEAAEYRPVPGFPEYLVGTDRTV